MPNVFKVCEVVFAGIHAIAKNSRNNIEKHPDFPCQIGQFRIDIYVL